MFSIALHENGPAATLRGINRAESLGVPAVWLTSGTQEQMTVLAVAAAQTRSIRLGTAVVPTWLRHPLILAQQTAVIDALAPGRFTLGIGPSHEPMMRDIFGIDFKRPVTQTREYLQILRQSFTTGRVDFDGDFFAVHAPTAPKVEVPIMVSALREASFRLGGEFADGAIAWVCPPRYLATKARQALLRGAAEAGRAVPPLIGHVFLAVCENDEAVRADARERLALYPRLPFYAKMLAEAGDAEGGSGLVSDRMIESVVIHGHEDACVEKLRAFKAQSTADQVIASLMVVGMEREAGLDAAMRVVARA